MLGTLELNTVAIIGSSLGAVSAVAFALDYPRRVSRLILVSPGLIGLDLNHDPKLVAYNQEMNDAGQDNSWDTYAEVFAKAWLDGPTRSSNEINAHVRKKVVLMVKENVAKRKPSVHLGFRMERTHAERLNELAMPVYVLLGTLDMADIKMAAEKFRAAGAEIVTFKKAAHMINLEYPQLFNLQLIQLLIK